MWNTTVISTVVSPSPAYRLTCMWAVRLKFQQPRPPTPPAFGTLSPQQWRHRAPNWSRGPLDRHRCPQRRQAPPTSTGPPTANRTDHGSHGAGIRTCLASNARCRRQRRSLSGAVNEAASTGLTAQQVQRMIRTGLRPMPQGQVPPRH
jgi:hypothetical protein